MNLETQQQADNTRTKLAMVEEQIKRARSRPQTPENLESLASLTSMANQLREEIIRFESRRKRQAS